MMQGLIINHFYSTHITLSTPVVGSSIRSSTCHDYAAPTDYDLFPTELHSRTPQQGFLALSSSSTSLRYAGTCFASGFHHTYHSWGRLFFWAMTSVSTQPVPPPPPTSVAVPCRLGMPLNSLAQRGIPKIMNFVCIERVSFVAGF